MADEPAAAPVTGAGEGATSGRGGNPTLAVEPPQATEQIIVDAVTMEAASGAGESAPTLAPVSPQPNQQDVEKEVEIANDKIPITPERVAETKTEEVADQGKLNNDEVTNNKEQIPSNDKGSINGDWEKREQELLKTIEELQVKDSTKQDALKLHLKVREEEIDLLKARVKNLETELQAAFSKPGAKNHEMIEHIKQQHEELLTKARGMIFDKTKMVKNQELQIEALTTQVQSLKDINQITKDLLEIRNSEVKAMEDKLEAMEARFKAEKDRYSLVLQRAQTSSGINDDLRKEYETQLAIFKELREKYELRVKALVAENERLKAPTQGGSSG